MRVGLEVARECRVSPSRRRGRLPYGIQVVSNPFVRLKVDAVQNAAALRYQHW